MNRKSIQRKFSIHKDEKGAPPAKKRHRTRAPLNVRGLELRHLLHATPFDNMELQQLRELFNRHAKNGNLEKAEFQKLFGVTAVLCDALYKKFHYIQTIGDLEEMSNQHIVQNRDEKKKGLDNFNECTWLHFLETTVCMGPRATLNDKVNFAFKMFDIDNDGFVEQKEFEEVLACTLDSVGIDIDEKVLNNQIQNGWNMLMKGSGLIKLSYSDFKEAAKANSTLLQPFSKTTEWMERILLSNQERKKDTILKDPKDNDNLLGYLNETLKDLEQSEIDTIREKLRNILINRLEDLQLVPISLLQSLNINQETIYLLKGSIPDAIGNPNISHQSIKSTKSKFLNLLLFACAITCVLCGVISQILDKRSIASMSGAKVPLILGKIFAYSIYAFILAIILPFTTTILTKISNIQYQKGYVFHYDQIHWILSWPLAFSCIIHSISHIFTYIAIQSESDISIGKSMGSHQGITGIILLVMIFALVAYLLLRERKSANDLILAIGVFFGILFWHARVGYKVGDYTISSQPGWLMLIPIIFLYVARKFLEQTITFASHITFAEQKLGKVLSVKCYKRDDFHFNCGQYVAVKCADIDSYSHTLYIASSPHEPTLSFNISSANDDWSARLYSKCAGISYPHLQISGPFGQPLMCRYRTIMLVCTGKGITPCAGMLSYLVHLVQDPHNGVNRIHFYWIVKQYTNFQWFYEMLCDLRRSTQKLSIHIFKLKKAGGVDANVGAMMLNFKSLSAGLNLDDKASRKSRKQSTRRVAPIALGNIVEPQDMESSEIKIGPPNFKAAFETVSEELSRLRKSEQRMKSRTSSRTLNAEVDSGVMKKNEVGVLFFGPEDLGNRIWTHCHEFSSASARFLFHYQHAETFPEEVFPEQKSSISLSVLPH